MTEELPFLNNPSYKWIFVGGKGGVGKTTTACSIAWALAKYRRKVLLVSTDPASNIGDTFQQHFTTEPQLVNGTTNLYAMESLANENVKSANSQKHMMENILSLPGVDELSVMNSLFHSIEHEEFDITVFDTAPTGHTMRLLDLPTNVKSIFGGLESMLPAAMSTASQLFGINPGSDGQNKLEHTQQLLTKVSQRLTNSLETTFVCVLLPEFLPLYETERLIQFLNDKNIESHVLVVNQVLDVEKTKCCPFCSKRSHMQQKYLGDIHDLYDDYRILEIGLKDEEVKGIQNVDAFSQQFKPLFE
ncbi:hypothetical protein TRFO_10963 [Tritrichomonas foetus]|uniref:ArsA/GET3 Anion-transporting ATPase-like domain-containing protein n=1 Tax=Tritrichomonas foetus TaxID=1144522 RepID=A0A1J4JAY7_9EUKA|nr:hypothetical protein TRFO_10963 [Tritrichomonas foetus]|eukprot:OHS94597.1 hypothetical protein TRFO_10963 [Tritrichomonas foetus]